MINKHFITTQINAIFSHFGYRLCRYPRCLRKAPKWELSLTIEHAVALVLANRSRQDLSPVTVVQIGAYPTGQDPFSLIAQLPHRLILVEPQPRAIARLKSQHCHDPQVQVIGSAIGNKAGTSPFYIIDNADGALPAWSEQLASFNRAHLEKFANTLPGIEPRIREMTVIVETLPAMLARLRIDLIDILMVDTEGYDYEILQQIPLLPRKPRVVFFEHSHLSRHDREAAWSLLVTLCYRIAVLDRDTVGTLDE